jgi:hypothetical protein
VPTVSVSTIKRRTAAVKFVRAASYACYLKFERSAFINIQTKSICVLMLLGGGESVF